jgi:hypothetical protein
MQYLISSKEAYSYLELHLTEAITTEYLQNAINNINIYISGLLRKAIILCPINKFIIFRGILGLIIMYLKLL